MSTIADILSAFVTGLLAFLATLVGMVLFVAAIPFVLVFAACFAMGLICAVAYVVQPNAHNLANALGFLGYAAVMFAGGYTFHSLPGVLGRTLARRRLKAERKALARVGGLRLATDAPFIEG